jgi:hypothetical protein
VAIAAEVIVTDAATAICISTAAKRDVGDRSKTLIGCPHRVLIQRKRHQQLVVELLVLSQALPSPILRGRETGTSH